LIHQQAPQNHAHHLGARWMNQLMLNKEGNMELNEIECQKIHSAFHTYINQCLDLMKALQKDMNKEQSEIFFMQTLVKLRESVYWMEGSVECVLRNLKKDN
jgi:hypothetical protein